MLTRALLVAAVVAAVAAVAQTGDRTEGLKSPTRLTVGLADQLLGQLAPDAGRVYFVSTVKTASEIAYQEPVGGRIRTLFDESADVTWPRVSPDGNRLAYVSLGDHATGQLCVRDLPEAKVRHCLEKPVGALQAEWMSSSRLGLVVRDSIQGDLQLVQVDVQETGLVAKDLPQKNLVSPAFSPDGRWLLYVPIARYSKEVGPGFAASVSPHLEAVRLDQPGEAPIPFTLDAPGVTAQPIFSRDGKWLYFVQFIHDSDHDGQVDALDHGVLFRVAFDSAADDAPKKAQLTVPEQLTDGSWNCQYPAPAQHLLVASCSQRDNVDVHEVPLDGVVPRSWSPERLKQEVELATEPEQELLLYHRVLESEPSLSSRHRAMVRMVRMHLELEDFVAARFYAKRLGDLEDAATIGASRPLQALVELREGQLQRERGRVVSGYAELVRKCLALLEPAPTDSLAARTLAGVVKSEVLQLAGDFHASRAALEAAEVTSKTPRAVLELYHDRADTLFRLLDDEPGLQTALRKLLAASRKPEVQLEYALAWSRSLVRGVSYDEKLKRIEHELAEAPEGSELRFTLELQQALTTIRGKESPGAIDALRALTRVQQRPDRKRAILIEASERAADFDAGDVLEVLAQDAVIEFPPGSPDRPRMEQLFTRIMMSRAYVHRAKGEFAEALEDFQEVARQTRSLEALVGALDLKLKEGGKSPQVIAELKKDTTLAPHLRTYGQAWVLVRGLNELDAKAQAERRKQAQAMLRTSWPQLKQHRLGQALMGALKHEEFLATADPAAVEQANSHYLTALRMSKGGPRQTAMLLGQLGLLQVDVGNYRLGLAQLDEREKFPYIDNGAGVAVELARARALLHVGRLNEAVETIEEAVAMTTRSPKLAVWHVLALDRAALTNLAAGKHARALALYDELLPSLKGRNEVVARLARAASALGAGQEARALDDLKVFDAALKRPEVVASLHLPHQTPEHALRAYQLISAGLRANAHQRLEQLEPMTAALEAQRALQFDEFAETDRDDDLRALVLAEGRLADVTAARGQSDVSLKWVTQALEHADQLSARTGAPLGQEQVNALWVWSTLYTRKGLSLPATLDARLKKTLGAMALTADPLWRVYERWFEVYLALDSVAAAP